LGLSSTPLSSRPLPFAVTKNKQLCIVTERAGVRPQMKAKERRTMINILRGVHLKKGSTSFGGTRVLATVTPLTPLLSFPMRNAGAHIKPNRTRFLLEPVGIALVYVTAMLVIPTFFDCVRSDCGKDEFLVFFCLPVVDFLLSSCSPISSAAFDLRTLSSSSSSLAKLLVFFFLHEA